MGKVRLSLAVAMAVVTLTLTSGVALAANSPYPTRRPHMGAQPSEVGTIYWNDKASQQGWSVYRWGSCGYQVGFFIDPSVATEFQSAAAVGVRSWNNGTYCGPRFVQVWTIAQAKVVVKMVLGAFCGGNTSDGWIALACRTRGASETDQTWTIGLSTGWAYGIGVANKVDVQSLLAVETGHVIYGGHNPNWDDSIQQNSFCTWAKTTCLVTNNGTMSNFANYTATCSNCGNRRTLLVGDWDFVRHLYGPALLVALNADPTPPDPPSEAGLAAQAQATSDRPAPGTQLVGELVGSRR